MSRRPDDITPEEREARIAELRARRRARMRTLAIRSGISVGVLVVLASLALYWLLQTRFFHLPRNRFGWSLFSVSGTGFGFLLSVLDGKGWDTKTQCEDIEFTLNAIADGHRAVLEPRAVFFDEQPQGLWTSIKQRYRWALGGVQIVPICTPRLWRRVRSGDRRAIDGLVYSVGLLVSAIAGWSGMAFSLMTAFRTGNWAALVLLSAAFGLFAYLFTLIFGWLTYLLVRGFLTRNGAQIAISIGVLVLYAGVLWGVLPTQPGVSWQAHLGGAVGGVLAAWWLHGRDASARKGF